MMAVENPALEAFVAGIGNELTLAQVLILRSSRGFDLRHIADRGSDDLKLVSVPELRAIAQVTATDAFRPLKSAPNLQGGWRAVAGDASELNAALGHLYPNAVADWFAARNAAPPITNYREFTNRQSGMYRITQLLNDAEVADVIQACCAPISCLKQRLWSNAGLEPDDPNFKSLIPCLEPCAILLESARKAVRVEQHKARQTGIEENA